MVQWISGKDESAKGGRQRENKDREKERETERERGNPGTEQAQCSWPAWDPHPIIARLLLGKRAM